LRNKYKDQKSIEQQFAEAKLVLEKDKENFVPALVIGGTALIYRYAPEITEAAVKYGPKLFQIIRMLKVRKKIKMNKLQM